MWVLSHYLLLSVGIVSIFLNLRISVFRNLRDGRESAFSTLSTKVLLEIIGRNLMRWSLLKKAAHKNHFLTYRSIKDLWVCWWMWWTKLIALGKSTQENSSITDLLGVSFFFKLTSVLGNCWELCGKHYYKRGSRIWKGCLVYNFLCVSAWAKMSTGEDFSATEWFQHKFIWW